MEPQISLGAVSEQRTNWEGGTLDWNHRKQKYKPIGIHCVDVFWHEMNKQRYQWNCPSGAGKDKVG